MLATNAGAISTIFPDSSNPAAVHDPTTDRLVMSISQTNPRQCGAAIAIGATAAPHHVLGTQNH